MEIKYPHIKVRLVGEDGNAFSIIGRVKKAMREGGCTEEQMDEYVAEATSGDYNHLLTVTMNTVAEESAEEEEDYDFSELNDYDEEFNEDNYDYNDYDEEERENNED